MEINREVDGVYGSAEKRMNVVQFCKLVEHFCTLKDFCGKGAASTFVSFAVFTPWGFVVRPCACCQTFAVCCFLENLHSHKSWGRPVCLSRE